MALNKNFDLDEGLALASEIRGVGLLAGAELVEHLVARIVELEDSLEGWADKWAVLNKELKGLKGLKIG